MSPHRPPVTVSGEIGTTPTQRGMLAAIFYLSGGLVALLAALAPGSHGGALATLGLTAVTVAVASHVLRRRFAYWATLATSTAGPLLIAVGIVAGDGSWASALLATLFTFVAIHTALVLRWEHAGLIQVWGAVSAVAAARLVAADLPAAVVATAYLVVCGTLWGVTTHLVRHVRREAATDPLTGLANRGSFGEALAHAMATVERTGEPLSLVALDLDGFKLVNDTRGHAAGDAVLVACADAWSRQLRGRDVLARTGGDEFVAILPGSDSDEAARVAARLRDAVAPTVLCSVGVAGWVAGQGADQLVTAADQALYRDKARRRGSPEGATSTAGS